jgi:hypothetical protein
MLLLGAQLLTAEKQAFSSAYPQAGRCRYSLGGLSAKTPVDINDYSRENISQLHELNTPTA